MMSLRLLRALLSALLAPIRWAMDLIRPAHAPRARAPVLGPSGPWMRAHVTAILPTPAPRMMRHHRARPAIVPPPPHILAILAAAPDVEPEFVRPAPAAAPHPTVVAPSEPATAIQAAPATRRRLRQRLHTWLPSLGLRLTRGCRAVAEWLVFDSPPDRRPA